MTRPPKDGDAPQVSEFALGAETFVVLSLPAAADDLLASLSEAERAVTLAALGGRSNAEIARERGTSARTVANQLAAVFRKLGVGSRAELAARLAGAADE